MPLVQAKCTNCGANLQVDNTKDAAICPYCNTPYVVEKAINNYNVTNHISANVVNVYGGNSADFVIRAGVLEQYNGASTVVVIPNSVKTIADGVFTDCANLTSVTIPNSVTSIGSDVFPQGQYKGIFEGCTSLTSVTIPNSVTKIGIRAFVECTSLPSIIIPNSVTKIGNSAFWKCTSLTSITIPNSVTKIGNSAFAACTSLTSIIIPNSVTEIGVGAFWGCTSLTSVTIPNSVTEIGDEAFVACASLTSITIPNGVTRIYKNTFLNCTSLTSVTIPNSVTVIEEGAFSSCKKLITIHASEAWKRAHWDVAPCISDYRPPEHNQTQQPTDGEQSAGGGCYIATAVYGSYDCPPVWTLRRYRDYRLAARWYGRLFIRAYYALSPIAVRRFGHTEWFKRVGKRRLDRMVAALNAQGIADTPYADRNW